MSDYTEEHAGALADVAEAGTAVSFVRTTPGTYDDATDTWSSPTSATVAGQAIQVAGDPKEYQRLGLVESEAPSLFFVPTTMGEVPALEATVSWGGTTYVVKSVKPLAPNGTAIAFTVIVRR